MTPRESAYVCLMRVIGDKAYSNLALGSEGGFTRRLVLGCLERKNTLEYVISRFAKKAPGIKANVLLMTGIYQLLYMDVPDNAACDETTELAKKYLDKVKSGFINAVMRSVCRSRKAIEKELLTAPDSVKYSLDESICKMLRDRYGSRADGIFESFFGQKKLFVRVNTVTSSASEVAGLTDGEIISAKTVSCDNAAKAVKNLESGKYFVQGFGSQSTVDLLDAFPDMTVADVCACPGGKSFACAIDMGGTGVVYAFDIHANKLTLIQSGAKRLSLNNINVACRDARVPNASLAGKCDRVICDVPCSGLGEIASKPDIRYKNTADFTRLYETQRAILRASASLLKSGGKMTYSTCTINTEENENAVREFLSEFTDFKLAFEHTFLPDDDGRGEGFYAALLIKE